MRHLILAALLVMGMGSAAAEPPTPPPAAPADAQPQSLLPALIEHSRHTARIENGRLVGEGADFLRGLEADAQFVMIGEEHGNEGVASFVEATWRDLASMGFAYAAIETDPWVAAALERELRAGGIEGWTKFVQAHGGATGAPFFTWSSEARLAQSILQNAPQRRGPTLWGLDQAFIGAAGWMLADIAANAHGPEARAIAARLAQEASGPGALQWLGKSDAQGLRDLRAALSHRRDAALAAQVDAMIESQAIYRPFTGGGGEANLANIARETMMKQLFLHNYRRAQATDRANPRVMMKFGAYHAYRGPTPTFANGLGGFVSEFAVSEGSHALTISVQCGPGGAVGGLFGPPTSCDEGYAENWGFLAPYVDADQLTVFDLRAWRLRPRRWQHLPTETVRFIASFDVVVFVPHGAPATFLPGLPTPTPPGP